MAFVNVDVDIDDILSDLSDSELQELVDNLYEDGYVAKKDPRHESLEYSDWDEKVGKLLRNKWRLSKEDEETILKIADKIV